MIVIPTYNEKDNIRPLIAAIRRAVPQEAILFIDDNSPDGTASEIRSVAAQDTNITLLIRPTRQGLGTAYREVFMKVAVEGTPAYVITMDADLSHPAYKLPEMIRLLAEYPVVVGSRYTPGGAIKNWQWYRRFLSRVANLYARIAGGVPITDLTSGFVGYRTEILQKLPLETIKSEGYAFMIEMKYLVYRSHTFMKEFPITFVERREGHSKLSWRVSLEAVRFTTSILLRRLL